jgi:hypothetical protein
VRQHCARCVRQPAALLAQLPMHPAVQYMAQHRLLSEPGTRRVYAKSKHTRALHAAVRCAAGSCPCILQYSTWHRYCQNQNQRRQQDMQRKLHTCALHAGACGSPLRCWPSCPCILQYRTRHSTGYCQTQDATCSPRSAVELCLAHAATRCAAGPAGRASCSSTRNNTGYCQTQHKHCQQDVQRKQHTRALHAGACGSPLRCCLSCLCILQQRTKHSTSQHRRMLGTAQATVRRRRCAEETRMCRRS